METTYQQAVQNFNGLRAFIPRFRESKVYMRSPDPLMSRIADAIGPMSSTPVTMRDQAVCALMNKACKHARRDQSAHGSGPWR